MSTLLKRITSSRRIAVRIVGISVVCFLVVIACREIRRQACISELVDKGASVEARYGAYQFMPRPRTASEDGKLVLLLGLGQHTVGFSAIGDRPKGLEWLVTRFGDRPFASVAKVWSGDMQFSDSDVDLLLVFRDLCEVDVSETDITDDGLIKLASLQRLSRLNVSSTSTSARSIRHLSNCKELKELDIRDTKADESVVNDLRKALPECMILWDRTAR